MTAKEPATLQKMSGEGELVTLCRAQEEEFGDAGLAIVLKMHVTFLFSFN